MASLQSLVACLLVCGATVGLHRMSSSADRLHSRILVGAIFLTLFVVDVYPYANKTWNLQEKDMPQTTPTIEPSLP